MVLSSTSQHLINRPKQLSFVRRRQEKLPRFSLPASQAWSSKHSSCTSLAPASYAPVQGTPIYLYDITSSTSSIVFAGLIQNLEYEWLGIGGDRICTVHAFRWSRFLTQYIAHTFQYRRQTCGFIVADLLSRLESGCPVTGGTISYGSTIPLLVTNYEKISDLFDTLGDDVSLRGA